MISVLVSFAASFACTKLPLVSQLSGGTRTIILTVVISSIVALIKPISENEDTMNERSLSGAEGPIENTTKISEEE